MSEVKLPISEVVSVIRDRIQDPETLKAIQNDLAQIQRELAAEKEEEKKDAASKTKNRFVVLIRSDDPKAAQIAAAGAYVVAVPDDETTDTYNGQALIERLRKAAIHHNEGGSKKSNRGRKRTLIKRFVDAMSWLKPKALKETESKVLIKTKTPVEVVVVAKEDLV